MIFIIGCAKEEDSSLLLREEAEEREGADEMSKDSEGRIMSFSLVGFTETGEKKWKIEGTSANIMSDRVELEDIKIRAYSQEGAVELTAQRGYFDKVTNAVHLEQNVIVVTGDGARLTADYLDWQAEDETISTAAAVFVERENISSWGTGAFAQPSLKKVRLDRDVKVAIKSSESSVSGDRPLVTTITSAGALEVDYEKQLAVFNTDVRVKDKRGSIFGDRIEVYLDPREERITKAIATGSVKIVREGNVTYSQKAVYEAKENKITLTGRPRLVIYPAKNEEM